MISGVNMPRARSGTSCWAEMRRRPVVTWYSGVRSCPSTDHGLAAVDRQDGAQCLSALALPGELQSTGAHLGFQPVERFVTLKITIEGLRTSYGSEEQTGKRDSVPAHVCHRHRV